MPDHPRGGRAPSGSTARRRRRRRAYPLLALALCAGAVAAMYGAGLFGGGRPRPALARSHGTAAKMAARLSPAQLAGQRIVYSYAGTTPPPALLDLIRGGEAAGVILFSGNISSAAQVRRVSAQLQAANASSPVHAPLLVMTDQEGGLVRRLSGPPALSQKRIGASLQRSALATAAGTSAGTFLRSAGVNVNLAPVLDVFATTGNFIDRYERSYSSDPAVVSALAAAFIGAQQRAGVAATAKHFPGLGTAARRDNTDLGAVTLNAPAASIRGVDELPYRAAIAAGVKLVMLSWAVYPALDPRAPAGLSYAIVHGELRGRLGFGGVTITDALGAGALKAYGGFGPRALAAVHAGDDLLLCATGTLNAQTLPDGVAALQALTGALEGNRLDRRYAEQAAARVLALRASL